MNKLKLFENFDNEFLFIIPDSDRKDNNIANLFNFGNKLHYFIDV